MSQHFNRTWGTLNASLQKVKIKSDQNLWLSVKFEFSNAGKDIKEGVGNT